VKDLSPRANPPTLTRLLEAMQDYFHELSDRIDKGEQRAKDEFAQLNPLFIFLAAEAPLCLWQDPNVDHSWKCQLWAGHRQDYHSCS